MEKTPYGDKGEDTLVNSGSDITTYIGGEGADHFVCGDGIDTITDFNAAEGDTKTADCENFLSNVSALMIITIQLVLHPILVVRQLKISHLLKKISHLIRPQLLR